MAALRSRCGHYIFALWFLSIFFFIPRLISSAADWMSTMCGPSANLECRSEMCCTQLAGIQYAKWCKKSPSAHRSNISPTCPCNTVNFGPLAAEIVSLVGAPRQISTGFASWQCYCTAKLWRWTEGTTCIRQGGHNVGHWPIFLVMYLENHALAEIEKKRRLKRIGVCC